MKYAAFEFIEDFLHFITSYNAFFEGFQYF